MSARFYGAVSFRSGRVNYRGDIRWKLLEDNFDRCWEDSGQPTRVGDSNTEILIIAITTMKKDSLGTSMIK